MNVHLCLTKKIILLAVALQVLGGCAATQHSHTDVSAPSHQEFVEFDALMEVPLPVAYHNILNGTQTCWRSPFSGQIVAYSNPVAQDASQISFVVPGKFLGSKVELATVRLYPADASRTRIVGSSFVYPGTWHLTDLASWAHAAPGSCAVAAESI